MKIISRTLGPVQTNCYFLINEETSGAIVVDPAENGRKLYEACEQMGVTPEAVLLTHGHFDHIMGLGSLRLAAQERGRQIPVYIHEADAELIRDPEQNLARGFGFGEYSDHEDFCVKDGDEMTLAGLSFRVMHTPGHTPGSCCYYFESEKVLISGDTLFCMSFGRTDFPGGSSRELIHSIKDILFALPEDTKVYPGHNEFTNIRFEKENNPISCY